MPPLALLPLTLPPLPPPPRPPPNTHTTRLFLKKLKTTLQIPVLALVDSDPYGLKILSVYMKVVVHTAHSTASTAQQSIPQHSTAQQQGVGRMWVASIARL